VITQTITDFIQKENRNQFKKLKTAVELEKWRSFYILPNEFFEETAI